MFIWLLSIRHLVSSFSVLRSPIFTPNTIFCGLGLTVFILSALCTCTYSCCCCLPTPPCLLGGVLPVPVSSLGFKCPDCFIWNCSYIYLSFNDERAIQGQLPKLFLPMLGVPDGGMCRHNLHSSLPDRCDSSTTCRLCRLEHVHILQHGRHF